MNWITIIQIASSVRSMIALCAMLGRLYLSVMSRKSAISLREIVDRKQIIASDRLVEVLKTFRSDAQRLEALKAILLNDENKSKRIVEKVTANLDIGALTLKQQENWIRALKWIGLVLLVLAIIGGASSVLPTEACHGLDLKRDQPVGAERIGIMQVAAPRTKVSAANLPEPAFQLPAIP